jgi:ferredoxin/flavodoxin---NADP+ reductase
LWVVIHRPIGEWLMAEKQYTVAILGAGPAGLYAAQLLAKNGVNVVVINRDVRPGGLAEYGIFHNKHKMKSGLRRVFGRILDHEKVEYRGHVCIGESQPITLADLDGIGFDAVLVAVGAQGIKWIQVDGSDASGIYDAKQLVYHYNGLPPYASQEFNLGDRLIVIGAGNVAVDITHWAVQQNVKQITWLVRRGPSQVKYTAKEIRYVGGHIDLDALKAEFKRIGPQLEAVGESPDEIWETMTGQFGDTRIENSDSKISMHFAAQANQVKVLEDGHFGGLEVTENTLELSGDRVRCTPTESRFTIDGDSLVFCVGDAVDTDLGLALDRWGDYAVAASDTEGEVGYAVQGRPGWFAVGWARVASDGLVGKAKKDAEQGCAILLNYLETCSPSQETSTVIDALDTLLSERGVVSIDWPHFQCVRAAEEERAEEEGLEDFRFTTDGELLRRAGLL